MEYDVARELGKPVYHFLAAPDCAFDAEFRDKPEDAARQKFQADYRDEVRGTLPVREYFKTADGLCARLGAVEFPEPLENAPRPDRYRTGQLPAPVNESLFVGRDDAVRELEAVREAGASRVVRPHGVGGVGKSTVLWHWLQHLRAAGFPALPQAPRPTPRRRADPRPHRRPDRSCRGRSG